MKRVATVLFLLVHCSASIAQNDDGFVFDDSMFDGADLFETSTEAPGNFRFQLSHQLVGNLSRHSYDTPGGDTDTQHRGLENNRLGLNVRYQNAFASGWLLQASAQARMYLQGDYEHNNPAREDREWRLNELFVQRSGPSNSFSIGRQTIVWGETIGLSVLDVINTAEYRDLTIIDIEDARLNQWLVVWDHFSDAGTWSSFINLYPEFNPVPVPGSPLFPAPPQMGGQALRLGSYDGDRELFELGTRWSRSFTGSDVAVMAARLYENPLRYTAPVDNSNRAQSHINDYTLLGFSTNRALGRLLLTLDIAYSQDVLTSTMEQLEMPDGSIAAMPGLETRDRAGLSTGFEYGITATQQVSMGLQLQRYVGLPADNAAITWLERDTQGLGLLRYSNNLSNDELIVSVTGQTALDGDEILVNLAADWRLSDALEASAQLILTRASSDSELYFLHRDVRAGLTLSWTF